MAGVWVARTQGIVGEIQGELGALELDDDVDTPRQRVRNKFIIVPHQKPEQNQTEPNRTEVAGRWRRWWYLTFDGIDSTTFSRLLRFWRCDRQRKVFASWTCCIDNLQRKLLPSDCNFCVHIANADNPQPVN